MRFHRYTITDSPALPKPVQPRVPLIIGGGGRRRTPALAARHATEYNTGFCTMAEQMERYERVRAACHAIGRDPAELRWSTALTVCAGRDDAEVARRAEAVGRTVVDLRGNALVGTPEEIVDTAGQYVEAGTQRFYLQVFDLDDLDHLELLAAEVASKLT